MPASATAEPPVIETTPAHAPSTGPDDDLMSMTVPDVDFVTEALESGADPMGTPSAAKPEPASKPDPAKPASTKPEPKGEPPVNLLRKELETTKQELIAHKTELAELKARYEQGDPRIIDAQKAVQEKEQEIADLRRQKDETEKELLLRHPAVSKRVDEMNREYSEELQDFYNRVPELDTGTMGELVKQYAKLPFGTPEYRAALAEFETHVNESLGGSEDSSHRKLDAVMGMVDKTVKFIRKRNAVFQEDSSKAQKLKHEADRGKYLSEKQRVAALLEKAKEVPDGMEETDPWHPKVSLKKFETAMGDKAVELTKNVPEFVEIVMAGLAPRSDEDYAGMTPQQIAESRATEQDRYGKARDHAVDVLYNGLKALRLFPVLVKEWKRLQEKGEAERKGLPPDPTQSGGGDGATTDDLKTFAPPDLEKMSF